MLICSHVAVQFQCERKFVVTDEPVACRVKRYGEIKSGVWDWSEWMLFQIPEVIRWESTATLIVEPLYIRPPLSTNHPDIRKGEA